MVKDRPRGILSPADRDYLKNPDDRSAPAQHKRREAIVERTHEGICDLAMLKATLPRELREKIVNYEDDQEIPLEEQRTLYNRIPGSLGFVFQLLIDNNSSPMSDLEVIEDFVAGAIQEVYTQRGTMVDRIDVSIEIELGDDLSELHGRDNLTANQARQMLEAGELSPEEYLDLAKEIPPGSGMGGMPMWAETNGNGDENENKEHSEE